MISHLVIIIFGFSQVASAAKNSTVLYREKKQQFLNNEELNRNILSQIYSMQKKLKKINHDKNLASIKKKNINDQIAKLQPVVDSANKKVISQKIEIQKRLQYIYKFQDMSFLKILFSAQAPSDLDRNLRILKNLTEHDYKNLKSYFKNIKTLTAKKKELDKKRIDALAFEEKVKQKELLLISESHKKNKLLGKIEKEKKNLLSKLQAIRTRKTKNLDDEKREKFLETLLEPLFFERKGDLLAPVQAKILQNYGEFTHPKYKTVFRHKGLFFRSRNDDVRAVAKGTIVHLERVPGQGYTVILDHGDHYFSIYSHLSDVVGILNQQVNEGEELGETGSFHPFFGAGLYFELRHFSEPVNPEEWFKL